MTKTWMELMVSESMTLIMTGRLETETPGSDADVAVESKRSPEVQAAESPGSGAKKNAKRRQHKYLWTAGIVALFLLHTRITRESVLAVMHNYIKPPNSVPVGPTRHTHTFRLDNPF